MRIRYVPFLQPPVVERVVTAAQLDDNFGIVFRFNAGLLGGGQASFVYSKLDGQHRELKFKVVSVPQSKFEGTSTCPQPPKGHRRLENENDPNHVSSDGGEWSHRAQFGLSDLGRHVAVSYAASDRPLARFRLSGSFESRDPLYQPVRFVAEDLEI